jgi:glycosyltransferase involved in cell wall biosynthesis
VATAAGGIPEFVQHEVTGVLVQPGHPSQLADALDRVLGDEALREELRGNARRQAEERFGTEGRYDLIASTYRRLLERDR